MRISTILLLLTLTCMQLNSQMSGPKPVQPVVVELFTSEGCSSCPPADAILADLDRSGKLDNIEVIPVGLHVDYWNTSHWVDRFSFHDASLRQERYAEQLHLDSPYTPQVVVDGHLNVLGNDRQAVLQAIRAASQEQKPALVTLEQRNGAIGVDVEHAPSGARVILAVTESNLSTSVRGGENSGRELRHAAVVRSFAPIGNIANGRFATTVPIAAHARNNPVHAIVLVQQPAGPIVGAATISLVGTP